MRLRHSIAVGRATMTLRLSPCSTRRRQLWMARA
jgi:hypothetical protein